MTSAGSGVPIEPQISAGFASIYGTVVDTTGAVVPEAKVVLSGPGREERIILAGGDGTFVFSGLPSGKYRITIASAGLGTYVSPELQLGAGESQEILRVILPIAPTNVDVLVIADQVGLATEQVRLAEQQRVFGILPDFYSSYIWDAPPLTARLKFGLAMKSVSDPVTFLAAGFIAGVEQAGNTFPGYGQGARGYAKRFGAAYVDNMTGRMLGSAILPTLLRQDPRYFYRGSGTNRARALYALAATFICKGDSGHWQFDYSYIGGSFGAAAIATLYHPAANRGISLVIQNALLDTGGHALNNVLREFLFKKFTPKAPAYAQGKP